MPPELIAQKRDNVQTLDLGKLARASSNSDVIDRGDVIEVTIAAGLDEDDSVTLPVRVNDQGLANIPEVGPVMLAGMDTQTAETVIGAACLERQLYRNPNVTVEMKRQRMNRVTVMGAVKNPDVYELPRGKSDLLAAIVAAGGLDKDAGPHVEIRNPRRAGRSRPDSIASGLHSGINPAGHTSDGGGTDALTVGGSEGGMESVRIDLVSATKQKTSEYQIEDGGVINIEKREPETVHVIGLVKKPGRYDFPVDSELRLTDAIAMGEGTTMSIADKVFVIRHIPNSMETAVIQVSLREAKRNGQANLRLEPSDVVSVESSPATAMYETFNIVRFNVSAGLPLFGSGIF